MSIGFTWEKLFNAVLALTRSGDTLQHRLTQADQEMRMLTLADFPDEELRVQYVRLVHALRLEGAGGAAGPVAPRPGGRPPAPARAIAETLVRLYTDITRLEEQHYRALSSRDL